MWRNRFLTAIALMVSTILVAGLSFAAGIHVAQDPTSSVASRLHIVGDTVGSFSTRTAKGVPAELEEEFNIFWEVWHIVEQDFFGETDHETMVQGAIEGMVDSLDDPYTQYVDPQHNAIRREEDSGKFEGIGATVHMINGKLTIVSPLKGSPADQAGLKASDVILKVDGTPVKDMDLIEAVSLVRGPEGSPVTLTIQREGVADPFTVSVVRAEIELTTVTSHMLTEEVGYLSIREFSGRTVEELDENLQDLQEQGIQALVLDLRNNPGGFLDTAVETVSRFVDEGPALWWQRNDGTSYPRHVKDRLTYDWPIVVLVNEGSASASEIVAGALRDSGRAKLVGTQSFGKGSVQNVHQLRDGGSVRVTTARWLTRDKHEIDGVGLEPDYFVTQDEGNTSVDRQLDFARHILQPQFGPALLIPYH